MNKTPITLKRKWQKAIVMAEIFPVAKDAKIAVAVVPILAPIVMGKTVSTVIIPAPIKGTKMHVVIDEL